MVKMIPHSKRRKLVVFTLESKHHRTLLTRNTQAIRRWPTRRLENSK